MAKRRYCDGDGGVKSMTKKLNIAVEYSKPTSGKGYLIIVNNAQCWLK